MVLAVGSLLNKIQFALEISLFKPPFTRISKLKRFKRLLFCRSIFLPPFFFYLFNLLAGNNGVFLAF